jgi:hypothetical protein
MEERVLKLKVAQARLHELRKRAESAYLGARRINTRFDPEAIEIRNRFDLVCRIDNALDLVSAIPNRLLP